MNNSELAFLGLSHNPFIQTGDAFYPGGQRKRLLDQLSHLSQWSRRSLLVTGVAGSGKTTLFDHLASGMEPKALAAKVHGEVSTSRRDVLSSVAQAFGVGAARDAKAEVLDELVRNYVDEQQQQDRLCVVLVDDTHNLDSRAIDTLLRLSLDCKVRIVMFAEPNVSRMVEEIGAKLDIACHETQLIGFGQADVRGYLEWRFEQANYRGRVPFTDAQVDTIAKVSSGLPGRIDELAGQELARLGSGDVEEEESSFPLTHRMLIGLLVVVFGLLYLLVSGGGDTPVPQVEPDVVAAAEPEVRPTTGNIATQAAMQPATDARGSTERPSTTPLPDPQDNNQAKVSRPALKSEQELAREQAAEAAKRKLQAERLAKEKAAEKAAAEKAKAQQLAEERKAQEEKAKEQKAREQKAEEERLLAERAAVEKSRLEAAQLAEQQEQQQPVEATTLPAVVPTVVPNPVPNPVPTSVPTPVPTPETAPSIATGSAGDRGERWLLLQDPQSYTLQLFTLSSAESVARYIGRQENPDVFATYSFRRAGKRFHVVVYGLYPSKAAASAASVQLPAAMDVKEPWIRPVEQIQNTIRALPAG